LFAWSRSSLESMSKGILALEFLNSLFLVQKCWANGRQNFRCTILFSEEIDGGGQGEKSGTSGMHEWISNSSRKCCDQHFGASLQDVSI
jgi:hypothetical protein